MIFSLSNIILSLHFVSTPPVQCSTVQCSSMALKRLIVLLVLSEHLYKIYIYKFLLLSVHTSRGWVVSRMRNIPYDGFPFPGDHFNLVSNTTTKATQGGRGGGWFPNFWLEKNEMHLLLQPASRPSWSVDGWSLNDRWLRGSSEAIPGLWLRGSSEAIPGLSSKRWLAGYVSHSRMNHTRQCAAVTFIILVADIINIPWTGPHYLDEATSIQLDLTT